MGHLADVGVEDRQLARVLGLLVADPAEERREPVIVIKRPAVERVVMALGALNAGAEEDLGDILGDQATVWSRSGSS